MKCIFPSYRKKKKIHAIKYHHLPASVLNETTVKGSISIHLHPFGLSIRCSFIQYSLFAHWGMIKYRLQSLMLFPQTLSAGCAGPAEVSLVAMNQRYLSYTRITYCSLAARCLWMKYKSQVIHIYASLQTTVAHPN